MLDIVKNMHENGSVGNKSTRRTHFNQSSVCAKIFTFFLYFHENVLNKTEISNEDKIP